MHAFRQYEIEVAEPYSLRTVQGDGHPGTDIVFLVQVDTADRVFFLRTRPGHP